MGTYNVIVTDINGCIIDSTITLVEPTQMTSLTSVTSNFTGFDISCVGATDGEVLVNVLEGSPNYSYEWTDVLGNVISIDQAPNGLGAGDYFVEITDNNGCVINDSITVGSPPPFDLTILVSTDYNGQDISCFLSEDGGVDLTVTGGAPLYNYVWTDILGNVISIDQNPTNFGAEEYFVSITDQNGCVTDTSIALTGPDIIQTVTSVISNYNGVDISCFGASDGEVLVDVIGGTPGYTYSWTNVGGVIVSTAFNAAGLPVGVYDVLVTDANGCSAVNNITLTQPNAVQAGIDIVSDFNGLPISCLGQEDGELIATSSGGVPGYTYIWNTTPVQPTQNAVGLGVGNYSVTVTDINGCQDTSNISIEGNPLPIIPALIQQEVCLGEVVMIQSQIADSQECEWYFSNGTYINGCGDIPVLFDEVGCYDVNLVVTGALGCVDSVFMEDYICINELPTAAFYANGYQYDIYDSSVDFINTSTGGSTYSWEFGDGTFGSSYDITHVFPSAEGAVYQVSLFVYSDAGCVDSAYRNVFINNDIIIYVPNTFTPDGDEFNNVFSPVISSGVDPQQYELLIFNRWGEIVFESHNYAIGWPGTYGRSGEKECQDGTYSWKITVGSDENSAVKTFIGHVNLLR